MNKVFASRKLLSRSIGSSKITSRAETGAMPETDSMTKSVVNSFNEWDPLEEVIVGDVFGSKIPEWHVAGKAVWPEKYWDMYKNKAGQSFPLELMIKAQQELDYLALVLEGEGVKVRRPDVHTMDFTKPMSTPDFDCQGGLYAAMPRDVLIVVGNEIIEAPMAWRSRYFEFRAFRKLVKEYFQVSIYVDKMYL